MIGRLMFLGVVALGLFVYINGPGSGGASATVTQTCDAAAPGAVTPAFAWQPAAGFSASELWLDIGLGAAMPAGSFRAYGPLPPETVAYTLTPLPAGVRFYYRINARTDDGWHQLAAGSFESACPQGAPPLP